LLEKRKDLRWTDKREEREKEELGTDENPLTTAQDPDERVRASAVKRLGTLRSEEAVRTLLTATTDLDRRVVANAVEGSKRRDLRN